MPLIFWIIGGAVALYAVAKVAAGNALAGVTGSDKQLGTGGQGKGQGEGGASGTQELTHDQKVALAKTLLTRWVYGEKDLADYNTLEVGAPGVNSYPNAAGAMAIILGANVTDGHAVLTNGALNPTQILVPHKPGGELTYAAPSTGFAIFLRPLEGNAIFSEAAGGSIGDQYKPGAGLPKNNPGEVSMLHPLPMNVKHLALAAAPAKAGSLDLGTGLGSSDPAKIHAQDLPDGDPVTLLYDDASGGAGAHGGSAGTATGYPLKVAREAYIRFLNGETGTQLANLLAGSSSLVFGKGYLQAAADLHNAAVTLGA